jgi:hypothetical protein
VEALTFERSLEMVQDENYEILKNASGTLITMCIVGTIVGPRRGMSSGYSSEDKIENALKAARKLARQMGIGEDQLPSILTTSFNKALEIITNRTLDSDMGFYDGVAKALAVYFVEVLGPKDERALPS